MAKLSFDVSKLRVLLIEDDAFAREQEMTALKHIGIRLIHVAEDGSEALEYLASGTSCDLIVSDWNMPNFDGLQLLKEVRKRWPGIAFLMVTNNESEDQIRIATDAGANGYLLKPFSLDKLRETIQVALAGRLTARSVTSSHRAEMTELDEVLAAVSNRIADSAGKHQIADDVERLKEAHRFAGNLSTRLATYTGSLNSTSPEQLAVIRVYADCIQAVLSGREDLLSHENRNLIIDGLSFATELAFGSE